MTTHQMPEGAAGVERLLRANRLLMLASERIARAGDVAALMNDLCHLALQEDYPMAWVGRRDAPDDPLVVLASAGDRTGYAERARATWGKGALGQGPIGLAIRSGKTVVNRDFLANPAMAPWRDLAAEAGFASSVGVPLVVGGRIWGIFSVYSGAADGFDALEVELFEALGRTIAAGLERLITRDRLIGMFQDVVVALTKAMEARDAYTVGHQMRVSGFCVRIGERLGLDEEARRGLQVAGLLHDIGKIAVPLELLNKTDPLTQDELALVRSHVEAGHAIIGHIDFPWPVVEAILQHHERLDGSGYPLGLRDNQICLWARILAVADMVDAVSHARSYRPALGIAAARASLQAARGRSMDDRVVDVALALLAEQG